MQAPVSHLDTTDFALTLILGMVVWIFGIPLPIHLLSSIPY